MAHIQVHTIVGENCITLEQGEPIYAAVHRLLSGGESVQLDFAGVVFCASPFLNAAIGRLLKDFAPADLEKNLIVQHLTPVGTQLMRKVIENSQRYYHDPDARKALDRILDEESD
jgi:hypothetical protein